MRPWKNALSFALALPLAACLGETPERARIVEARLLGEGDAAVLEVTQDLQFSRSMREALEHGIPLRLGYRIDTCHGIQGQVLRLSYSPLHRRYELQHEGESQARRFARLSALLAALDRVRLPLATVPVAGCRGSVAVALDLTSLPTPLRFPALFQPDQWRLISAPTAWTVPSPRA